MIRRDARLFCIIPYLFIDLINYHYAFYAI
ncbi:hypothetical protein AI2828V5_0362 [Klebsiella oxytoca]|nr:hypothetical protein KOCBH_02393 [Klebsiella michiganensis]CAF2378587.1 hypothetical protein AI2828V5_0362 [Klebsiella oxytoca]CAH5809500.1 hypothetical protein AI2828V5_0362 [Klebsiella oxytoca]CAH6061722.1 hypothetical protein AN2336V5_0600 [Klebsiella oxytoca]SAP78194.1 Uncharacterised protein [Klebsiella michiganensis]